MTTDVLDLGSLAELERSPGAAPEPTGSRFVAAIYDPFLALAERAGMRERRRKLLASARGRVLEIGAGTGLNLDHYPAAVDQVHVRSDSPRLERWQRRLARPWAGFAEGCRCDQPTLELIGRQLRIECVERESWRRMPSLVRPLAIGEAVA